MCILDSLLNYSEIILNTRSEINSNEHHRHALNMDLFIPVSLKSQ